MDKELRKLNKGISFIRERISKDLAMNQLYIFLSICEKEGQSMYDLAPLLDVPLSTISRNTKELSKYIEKDSKTGEKVLQGYDLIRSEQDIEERRRLVFFLTPKGKKLRDELIKYLKEEE